jgi:glycosyltransferase involved in cell wall biosynthesis
MSPIVSVIIPLYKGERYIAKAVQSVLDQTFQNFELIIVNDGSPDNCKEIIQSYLRDPRVKYIEQLNAGVANARNTGIRHATGDYLAFLDQDDLWHVTKLAKQVDFMEKHPEAALSHCNVGFIDAEGRTLATPAWAWVKETTGHCAEDLILANRIATLTVLLRRSCIDKIGMFRQELAPADDWDLWLRLSVCYSFGFIPELLGYYRLHGNNESKKFLKMRIAETRVIERFVCEQSGAAQTLNGVSRSKLLHLYKKTAQLASFELDKVVARQYWLKALSIQPWGLEIYAGLAWNWLSPSSRRILKWYWSKLFPKDQTVS